MRVHGADEAGMTLAELLIAMTILIGIVGATLTTLGTSETTNQRVIAQNESQDQVRRAVETIQSELRNLASPTADLPQAVDKAKPDDIVFQTVDPVGPNGGQNLANIRRVRYCLNASVPTNAKVWTQSQTWTLPAAPAIPATASCPDPAWGNSREVARFITNQRNGASRPVWTFNACPNTVTGCTTSAELSAVTSIRTDLFVDQDVTDNPGEAQLTSGVALRNQNAAPRAEFTKTIVGTNFVLLNGSASEDVEGKPLRYRWYDNGVAIPNATSVVFQHMLTPGTHNLSLTVFDPADLSGTAPVQTVVQP